MNLVHCKSSAGRDVWINIGMVQAIEATVPNKECKVWLALDNYWIVAEAAQALAWRLHKAGANDEQT